MALRKDETGDTNVAKLVATGTLQRKVLYHRLNLYLLGTLHIDVQVKCT